MDPYSNIVPTLMITKEEGNSEMTEGRCNCVYVDRCSRPYNSTRCKCKSSSKSIESLPDELVYNILLHLSAQDIYDSAMLVCQKWSNIIHNRNFMYEHLYHSTPGLLIQSCIEPENIVFVALHRGRIEIRKFPYKWEGTVRTSCNGLILIDKIYASYIANPATKQRLAIPPVFLPRVYRNCYVTAAYAPASMQYKVVAVWFCMYARSREHICAIFTVGSDKSWRYNHIKHLSTESSTLEYSVPLTTEGFIHWTCSGGTHVLTLNAETETITKNHVPEGYRGRIMHYVSTGTFLNLFIECGEFSWEVLEMEPETGEWTKMPKIDLEPYKGKFEHYPHRLKPVGWFNYPEVLVLQDVASNHLVYNARTQEIDFFQLDHDFRDSCVNLHRNSLVWLDGC